MLGRVREMQKRGVLHVHVVLGIVVAAPGPARRLLSERLTEKQ